LRRGLEPVVTAQGAAETAFAEQLAMDVPGLRFLPGLEIQALRTRSMRRGSSSASIPGWAALPIGSAAPC